MKSFLIATLVLPLFCPPSSIAQKTSPDAPLPSVLIVGDSISIGYTRFVTEQLKGRAAVTHSPGNAGPTMRGVANIDRWLGRTKPDVIVFNFGLWDMYGWQYEKDDRSPAAYEKRLNTLVQRLQATGAKLIWATTTPVCPGAEKKCKVKVDPKLEKEYLAAALRVMKKHGVAVCHLHKFMQPRRDRYAVADNDVHYTKDGYRELAKQVAHRIRSTLADEPRTGERTERRST